MSNSTDKKRRKEFRRQFDKMIESNKDMVLQEVIRIVMSEPFIIRFAFCWKILFGKIK